MACWKGGCKACIPCSNDGGGGLGRRSAGHLRLNVGGSSFAISEATLSKCPKGSVLEKLLLEQPPPDGTYFIDRDGRHFHHVLNFLRDGAEGFLVPVSEDTRRELHREATFLGLSALAELVQESYVGAPMPPNEAERIKRLDGLEIMHTDEHDHTYDGMTRVVAAILDIPIVLVSLVHEGHQWFKSRCGLDGNNTARNTSFCAFTLLPAGPENASMFVVEDATKDARVSNNPLVLGGPDIRFYAGCPIMTSDGVRLGAFCAIDRTPRTLTYTQAQMLVNFATLTAQEIERKELLDKGAQQDGVDLTATAPEKANFAAGPLRSDRMREALGEMVCLVQVRFGSRRSRLLYANRMWSSFTGCRIMAPERFPGKVVLDGPGGRASAEPCLWDWLQLVGSPPDELTEMFHSSQPFAVSATLLTQDPNKDRIQVSCRFCPAGQPLDANAAAIRTIPHASSASPAEQSSTGSLLPNSAVFFVTMVPQQSISTLTEEAAHKTGQTLDSVAALRPPKPPSADVRLIRLVGEGSFGKVYHGLWCGSSVAVKIIESRTSGDRFEPAFEAALSMKLSHPNLVQTFKFSSRPKQAGYETSDPSTDIMETWIVQEWCDRGTLGQLCQKPRHDDQSLPEVSGTCMEIAGAGSYLHSRGIIHGDLTANNVLIKSQLSQKGYVCKLCDFGLSLVLEGERAEIITTQLGTVTHMPPELFQVDSDDLKLTTKADVYAAGILTWQILTGKIPFDGLSAPQIVMQVARKKCLKLPEDTPKVMKDLFARCTAHDPAGRPEFEEVVESLAQAIDALESRG